MTTTSDQLEGLGTYKFGWADSDVAGADAKRGLSEAVVRDISAKKSEPEWMLKMRLRGLSLFGKKPMPTWGSDLSGIHFDNIKYFVRSTEKQATSWDELPDDIKSTYDRLGIPEAEKQRLVAGVAAQYESEVVYHQIREDLAEKGVVFVDTDTALREHADMFREYFGTVIPVGDNKFAALNTAVWSGGSFIYVPKGVKVDIPLQAYFRINTENMGQFERTLIIADEGSSVHYVEGCTAPIYSSDSLHSAVVEIIVKKDAHVRYTTIQNWSNNVYNLVTKRTSVAEGGRMEWIDGNIGCLAEGSRVTTPHGVKPIEQLTPGEQVLAWDDAAGELCFRTVLGKRYSGAAPVREVRVGERALRVTDNHPFLSYRYDPTSPKKLGRYALDYVRADALSEAIVPTGSIEYGRPHKLEQPDTVTVFNGGNQYASGFRSERARTARLDVGEETTDDLMWLFGAFTGDGSIDVKPSESGGMRYAKVTFSIPTNDRAHARLREVMRSVLPGVEPGIRADGVASGWNSVELAELLTANGMVTGASAKRVPDWVLSLPESQRLQFVAGYLDTDGCGSKGRRGLSLKSVNRELLSGVADVLTSLGIVCWLSTEFDEPRTVTIMGNTSTARAAHRLDLRADLRLVRLLSAALQEAVEAQVSAKLRHFRTVGGSNIVLPETVEIRKAAVSEHLETVPTWDIEVEGVGNFVSEGFIVHNSKVTMKYPACYLLGERASGETLSVAFAGEGQHQDAGAKMVHAAPHTTSNIVSKSVARGGGRTSYRGLVQVQEGATGSKSNVVCDALLVDTISRSDTYPYVDVREDDVSLGHEATVSKVGDDQLFYLMSRGLSETEAMAMIVRGFVEPIARELPMEYALELNRLIELQMEGSVG